MRFVKKAAKLDAALKFKSLQADARVFKHYRAKIVKYPSPTDDSSDQGVGPHFDGGFLTLVCSAMAMEYSYMTFVAEFTFVSSFKRLLIEACRCKTCRENGLMLALFQEPLW